MLRSVAGRRSMPRTLAVALLTFSAALTALCAPAVGAVAHRSAARLAPGYYQCYQTSMDVSPINGGVSYSTIFKSSFTVQSKHRYSVSFLYSGNEGPGVFVIKGHSVRFVGGSFDSNSRFWHLKGTVYPGGVTMPHSTISLTKRYKLVLRGSPNDSDGAPPTSEFTGAVPRSFWYCNKR